MTRQGLELSAVSLYYAKVQALEDVSLCISPGESVAITGPSGSGKSSLMKVSSGLVIPTSGDVVVGGRNLGAMSEAEKSAFRASSVGFVFQDYNLIDHLTAIENVELAWCLRRHHTSPTEALSLVGLDGRLHHMPSELSGGEQQRVSIARAICGGPEIIFADEPTGALDSKTAGEAIELLLGLHSNFPLTLVVVTHTEDIAQRMARRVVLDNGHLDDETS